MHGDQLSLQVGGEFADGHSGVGALPEQFVAVVLAGGGALQIRALRAQRRQLDAPVAEVRRPARQVGQGVEGRLVIEKLGEKDRRALEAGTSVGGHVQAPGVGKGVQAPGADGWPGRFR